MINKADYQPREEVTSEKFVEFTKRDRAEP